MSTRIGDTVQIADPYTVGLMNDHVSVQRTPAVESKNDSYNVYARMQYNIGGGPMPIPGMLDSAMLFRDFLNGKGVRSGREISRGWSSVDTLCQDVTLDTAMELAESEAKRRGVVLYLADITTTTIMWQPDKWQPRFG